MFCYRKTRPKLPDKRKKKKNDAFGNHWVNHLFKEATLLSEPKVFSNSMPLLSNPELESKDFIVIVLKKYK